MVKKIQGPSSKAPSTGSVESTKAVETTKTREVSEVSATKEKGKTERVSGHLMPITGQNREQIFQLINEEADKLFGESSPHKNKRKMVEGAVKMAIDASVIENDSQSKGSKRPGGK